ncbi:putative Zn(II)2Cys6 transcription factor [Aspergillus mulundensis]|uniref:Putative Zn(II)2Cys6 transcription factor n=1 Tax=Aspergillus mulundensis TaxID=1810919 RepID=A0A3D8RST8_9EURO|nr:putative Zn(II)2Cys6 transcription factor [Aspergillus mulundensis]RDW76881.1 putative Zn(II)2Cys6 transcription factor [Aspergillus mulundensis]
MIAAPGPERRRRRPAVSCSLCRRRKIRCNRESPCSNCIKSKAEPCVYDAEALPRPQQHLGFSRTAELDLCKATNDRQMLPPDAVASLPSYASRSIPSSTKGSSSQASHASVSEVESMKTRIRQLEEQLAKVAEPTRPPPPPSQSSRMETSTSEIAGTFHINHESRMGHDSQFFRDVFEMIEPFIRGKASKVGFGIKRCKELARTIKAQRTPQWPTPPTSDLPPKGVADELVDCYLRTIETTFRVLHVPTFKTEYDALWVSDAQPSTAFTVQLKLVLALGAITYDERFSMRPSAVRWVYEAHTWLSDPDFKPQLNMQALQSRVLLTLAREIINVGGDSTWISAGALLRTALHMGLHRDPSALPPRSTLAAEMRRRLWNTILELCLQSSISSGGAPLLSLNDFDCAAPGNFDDEQLMTEDPVPKADDEYTQTSIARALRRTYPQRLAIAKFLNDLGSYGTYEGTLRLDAELRESYRAVCRTLRGYSSRGPSPSKFETCVLDFMIHYYVCCLHMPLFEKSLGEAAYAFSRKVTIESALKMWYAIYPSSTIINSARGEDALDKGNITRFVECGFGFFRTGSMVATMFVSLELKTQLQDEDSLGPSPYRVDLFSLLCDARERSWNMIECGETNVKGYLLACLVTAQIEGLMKGVEASRLPEYLLQAAEAAEDRCLAFMEEKAGQGQVGGSTETLDQMSANTAPFMGDWEFIMTDSFLNYPGNIEPISWVLNNETRPFMM